MPARGVVELQGGSLRETEILLDQLNRAFGGEAWHGPALRNLLDGLRVRQAKAHPIEAGHSILDLVVHIMTWMDVVARRLGGETVDSGSVPDWTDTSAAAWRGAIEALENAQSRLCDAVARLGGEALKSKESEILGVLQHTVYHAGQIGILKKAV